MNITNRGGGSSSNDGNGNNNNDNVNEANNYKGRGTRWHWVKEVTGDEGVENNKLRQ